MNEQIKPSKGAPLFNPWSPESIANPYPSYHLLRETGPCTTCGWAYTRSGNRLPAKCPTNSGSRASWKSLQAR